jgi:5-dehydro-2-deoxygluconokinase
VDVCVLGRIGYDLYAMEHHRPLPEVEHFSRHLGGSSANIAVGLARLGLKVGIISSIGKDELAAFLLDFLASEGVDTQYVQLVEGHNTSLCLTEICPPASFRQVFYRADPADAYLRLEPEARDYIRQARMFITNGTSLAASPSRESTRAALEIARQHGLRTVLDVDYRASSWTSPEMAGEQARAPLAWVDVVLGNEYEIALLTGSQDAEQQVKLLEDSHVKVIVRKLGERGAEAYYGDQHFSLPPTPRRVLSAIGAGDAFAAGFLYALDRGLPIDVCLRYGNAASAIVVSRVPCSDAMPYRREVEALVKTAEPRCTT